MKSQKTVTRTQAVTNTKLAVATGAMLLALGSALAVLPGAANQPTRSQIQASCAAVITSSERECRLRANVVGYREFRYTCPDGRAFAMRSGCKTLTTAQTRANEVCLLRNRRQMCVRAVAPVAQAITFPDMAFVGGVSFYQDQDGVAKARLRYTNRGSVNLPNIPNRSYRLLISGLDENQQPLVNGAVESVALYPLNAGQVFDQVVDRLPEDAAFVKFELQIVGSPSDTEPTDRDLSNNVLMSSLPPRPFLPGFDLLPEQYSDLTISGVQVDNGLLRITVVNQGNTPILSIEDGLQVRLYGQNNTLIRDNREQIPALGVGEETTFSTSAPPEAIRVSVSLDPENLGNEPKLLSPNPMRENNVFEGPMVSAPKVSWSDDSPIGRVSAGSGHLIGKLVLTNTNTENVGMSVSSLAFQVQSDITVSQDIPRYIKFYQDGLEGDPILLGQFEPSQLRQEFFFDQPLTIGPGGSKTIFITADTNDGVRGNYFSFRVAPKNGMRWSAGDGGESTFLNSPVMRFRTLAF